MFLLPRPLTEADASVDHLVARANGGNNDEENCVACCKAANGLFEKASRPGNDVPPRSFADDVRFVIDNLQTRGPAKPKALKTLMSTIHSRFIEIQDTKVAYRQ